MTWIDARQANYRGVRKKVVSKRVGFGRCSTVPKFPPKTIYRRGIGVRVKGVPGSDAIVAQYQEPLNAPFLNGLFSSGFSRGKTAP